MFQSIENSFPIKPEPVHVRNPDEKVASADKEVLEIFMKTLKFEK
jgi:hypothetical protein